MTLSVARYPVMSTSEGFDAYNELYIQVPSCGRDTACVARHFTRRFTGGWRAIRDRHSLDGMSAVGCMRRIRPGSESVAED